MSSHHTTEQFVQFAEAIGVNRFDAANRIMAEVRLGKKPARWIRRAARSIIRRASGSEA